MLQADELLKTLEEYEEGLDLEKKALAAADTKAKRGEVALSQLRYVDTANHFRDAAKKVPRTAEDEYTNYLDKAADAFYRQGDEFGDNAALLSAIEISRTVLRQRTRERVPLDWATTQNNLGTAFATLGERESGTARLEEAVAAIRLAFRVYHDAGYTQHDNYFEKRIAGITALIHARRGQ